MVQTKYSAVICTAKTRKQLIQPLVRKTVREDREYITAFG